MSDAALVITLMVFSHLVADFVLQNDWIAIHKGTGGREGWSALALHGFHVGLCLSPIVLAFGLRGLAALVLVVVSHVVVDRWKVRATRHAGAVAQARALAERNGADTTSGLGAAWSPWPGILFVADQILHVTFLLVAWLVFITGATLLPEFQTFVETVIGEWDLATVHATVLTGVVLISLAIVNTRGGFYLVMSVVTPRPLEIPVGGDATRPEPTGPGAAAGATTEAAGPAAATGPAAAPVSSFAEEPVAARAGSAVPVGATARVSATIGGLERLLVVALILAGAWVAVGLLLVVKTIARFRQLQDPGYVEYYLLGTLASISVAVLSAAAALAALSTIGL